jgi:hypothetical protein
MTTEFCFDHIFRTNLSVTKFEALVTKACRAPFKIELTAHDPNVIPQIRLFTVGFTTPEDRDRARIAMRFVEKEQAAMAAASNTPRTAASGRLASA